MSGIKISQDDREDLFLGFKSKIELKKNVFYQKVLQDYHGSLKKEGAELSCTCNDVVMACKYTSYYFLSNLPNNSNSHKESCMYYEHLEELTDNEDKYKPLIFQEPIIDFSKSSQKQIEENNKKEAHRRNTYNNFCIDMISEAYSKAFNFKNKGLENRADLSYPNYNDVLRAFNILIKKNELLSTQSINESLNDYYSFSYGLLNYDFISQLEKKEKEYEIILSAVKNKFSDDRRFLGYETKEIECKINFHTLKASTDLVKNFGAYIKPPYFYMAVYRQFKDYKKIVRLFLYPVYFDEQYMVLVDSGYERKYAKYLVKNNIPFIKPITDGCFYKISGKLVNYENKYKVQKRAFLQYLPDFIEFKKDNIYITEVGGYDNPEYQLSMNRKLNHYENESKKSNKLYIGKKVDGKTI